MNKDTKEWITITAKVIGLVSVGLFGLFYLMIVNYDHVYHLVNK